MARKPTEEQEAVLTRGTEPGHMVIKALAGTGKTSTLEMLSHRMSGKGLYLAFNRAIAQEAKQRFSSHVTCKTFHGLAFGALGHQYVHRLEGKDNGQLSVFRIQKALRLTAIESISPLARASLVKTTLGQFMQSASRVCGEEHVPIQKLALMLGGETSDCRTMQRIVAQDAATLWDMIWHPGSTLPVSHEAYLKAYCLTDPALPFDYIKVDEGQDLSPMMIDLITRQSAKMVMVGDPHQQIYEWRGACSALEQLPDATTCYLTRSFRFGDHIARQANMMLGNLEAERPIYGTDMDRRSLTGTPTLLFRSNMGLFGELLRRSIGQQQPCHIVGGAADMVALLNAAVSLKSGKPTAHPDLAGFSSWREFTRTAEQDAAPREMQQLLKIVETYSPKALIYALRAGSRTEEKDASIVLSTAHKSKGREFPDVRVGPDFPLPSPVIDDPEAPFEAEEARLAYVTITRAQRSLQGHEAMVEAYRDRLKALVSQENEVAQARRDADTLAKRLARMTGPERLDAVRQLAPAQKKALNEHLAKRA